MRNVFSLQRTGTGGAREAKAASNNQLAVYNTLGKHQPSVGWIGSFLDSRRRRKNVVKSTFTLRAATLVLAGGGAKLWAYPLGYVTVYASTRELFTPERHAT